MRVEDALNGVESLQGSVKDFSTMDSGVRNSDTALQRGNAVQYFCTFPITCSFCFRFFSLNIYDYLLVWYSAVAKNTEQLRKFLSLPHGKPRCTACLTKLLPKRVGSKTKTWCPPRKPFSAVFMPFLSRAAFPFFPLRSSLLCLHRLPPPPFKCNYVA